MPLESVIHILLIALSHFSYLAIFIFLLLLSLGLAISEDVALLIIGYLVAKGYIAMVPTLAVALAGIGASDAITYLIGYLLGGSLLRNKWLLKIVKPHRVEKGERWFARWGEKAIFVARFIIGVRFQVFVTAGMMRMKFLRFLLVDSLAALLFVPLMILLGYFCSKDLEIVAKWISSSSQRISIVVAVSFFVFVIYKLLTKKMKKVAKT
ncbi:MAG: DedA family protein [Candidatus Edwardsbacteria bacterium]